MLDTVTRPEGEIGAACEEAADARHRVIVTRDGEPWVAVVPLDDLAWLEAVEDRRDAAELRKARAEWEASGRKGSALDEVAARLGLEV